MFISLKIGHNKDQRVNTVNSIAFSNVGSSQNTKRLDLSGKAGKMNHFKVSYMSISLRRFHNNVGFLTFS